MKQGLKKFQGDTQGKRATQGQKVGEKFVKDILEILKINIIEPKQYSAIINTIKTSMKPDFIVKPSHTSIEIFGNIDYIFLESKFKQIAGSDWEKIESNFGFHNFFYNQLCNINIQTIVILSGFWKKLQKNYYHFMYYFKRIYGENIIFDFGDSVDEIYRFAEFMDISLTNEQKNNIINIWNKNFKI